MIILDLDALQAFVLILSCVSLLAVVAFIAYGLGLERGSRRR